MAVVSRIAIGVLAILMISGLLGACGSDDATPSAASASGPPTGSLRVFAYEDGFAPAYIKPFKKQYPDVDLRTSSYDSGDAAVVKMRAGFQTDIVNLCVEENAERAVALGLLQPIDTSRLEHWDRLFPAFKGLPGVTVNGKTYMVPVDAGVTGIIYRTDKIDPAPTRFADLFDDTYAGRVAMIDYPVTAIQVGALALGFSDPQHLTDEQLAQVRELYLSKKSNFRTLWSSWSDITQLFKTGEIWISVGYPGYPTDLKKEGVPVDFALAEEGQLLWTCGYGISKDCTNLDAAYALLNYYTSPEAQAYEASEWHYMVSNQDTLDVVSDKVRTEAGLDRPTDLGNALPAGPPKTGYDKWVRVWQEFKVK
jgi:spermidine/putrescine-binding protein